MRVTTLGTGSADGWPNPFCRCTSCESERAAGRSRRPSAALVDDVILIDCGPTTPHLPPHLTLAAVEHVLLTHGHPDHLHPAFLLTRDWTHPGTELHVWGPASAIDLCRDWCGPDSAVVLHEVRPGMHWTLTTSVGDFAVAALEARHAHGDGDIHAEQAVLYRVSGPDGASMLYATDTGPFDPVEIGLLPDPLDVALIDETFGDTTDHGTGHLDLATLPAQLERLRTHGAVDSRTRVLATHLSHHNPPSADLAARLEAMGVELASDFDVIDTARRQAPAAAGVRAVDQHILVLGGARSGKSTFAESLLLDVPEVTYIATGGSRPGDAEWLARVAAHRARRPDTWTTVETSDVCTALDRAEGPVLVDCLALWLTARLDGLDAWSRLDAGEWTSILDDAGREIAALAAALRACRRTVVLVSNEVGMGVVPATASGRLFADLLGALNAAVADACDRTVLMVAGRPLVLDGPTGDRA